MGTAICMPRFRAPPTLQPILRHYSSSGSSQTCHNIGGLLMVPLLCFVGISSIEEWRSFYNANWLGWGWGELRVLDHRPALGTVLWPPTSVYALRLDGSVQIHRPDAIKVEPGMKSLKPNLPSRTAPAIGGTMKGFRSDLQPEV